MPDEKKKLEDDQQRKEQESGQPKPLELEDLETRVDPKGGVPGGLATPGAINW